MTSTATVLTDDHIERLLQEAEARLAAKESGQSETVVAVSSQSSKDIAKVREDGQKSPTKPSSLPVAGPSQKVQREEKLLVRVPRHSVSKSQKVSSNYCSPFPIHKPLYDESFSNLIEVAIATRHGLHCYARMIDSYHSYSDFNLLLGLCSDLISSAHATDRIERQ
jgi:hypothetical protein